MAEWGRAPMERWRASACAAATALVITRGSYSVRARGSTSPTGLLTGISSLEGLFRRHDSSRVLNLGGTPSPTCSAAEYEAAPKERPVPPEHPVAALVRSERPAVQGRFGGRS